MVKLNVGQVFATKDFKQGEKDGRKWAMVEFKAEKGFDKITIWTDGLEDGENQELTKILSVTKSARKGQDKDGNEKWYDTYSVNASFKSTDDSPVSGFAKIEDESIPF